MAQFMYILRPVRPDMLTGRGLTAEEGRLLAEHFAYLQGLLAQGSLKLAGRTVTSGPETMGIAVFEAADEAAARAIMAADPAVSEGVMTAEVFPFRISLMADGQGIAG
jgi:uncharacterized protein YciI